MRFAGHEPRRGFLAALTALVVGLLSGPSMGATYQNSATGTTNGSALDATAATVSLNRNFAPTAEDDAFTVAEDSVANALDVKADNGNGVDSDPDGDVLSVSAVGPTDNGGTASINDAGTPGDTTDDFVEYTPALDFFGVETFTYTIDDGNGETAVGTVTVTVTNSNDPPTAEDDAFTVAEDSIANALDVKADNGSGADSDPDGDVLSVTAVGATDNGGTASINDAGTPLDTTDDFIEYTPAADFFGVETFTYTIDDGNGETAVATVTVTVTNSNDPPIAEDDAFTVAEDSIANALDVKVDNGNGADSDPDGDTLSVTAVGATDNGGTASINDAGTPLDTTDDFIEYTPAADFFGVETFSYTIDDGNGQTDTATVTVTVTNSNDPPIAEDDAFTVAEDSIANALDVKVDNGNGADSDPDGDTLSVTTVGATDNGGTASINDAGTPGDTTDDFVEYTPALDFFGVETFTYTIDDGNGQTDTATVTVTVTNSNDPPIAEDDAFTVAEDSVANALDVKVDNGNGADSDPDGDTLSVTAVGATDNGGTASISDAGTPGDTTDDFVEYTPALDFFGVETFTYTIDDGNGQTDTATVTVTVTNSNDPPTAEDDAFTVAEDSVANALDVKADNGSGADSDPDGDVLSVTAVGATDNGGTASINDAGTPLDLTDDFIEYTPAADFFGVETFSYTIDDGNGQTDTATVTVTVTNSNDPPIAEDDAFTVAEDSIANALDVKVDNGNGADSDPDGDTLSVTAVGATDNGGTASINDAGTPLDTTDDFIEYTPAADFFGVETFSYTIDDGNGQTDTATVTVTVTNSNDPPIAEDDAFTVAEDSIANALDVKVDNGNGADSDPDGDTLSVTTVGATDNGGTASINDAGTPGDTTDDFVEYTPALDFFGVETFTYTIDDGNGQTDTATVTVTVTNSNDPPIAEDDAFTVAEDSVANALDVKVDNGSGADSDPDGDVLSVTAVGATDNGGTASINDAGTPLDTTDDFIEYTPAADIFGVETFTYTIDDGNGQTDTATVTVTVTNSNDPPTAEDDAFTVAEDSVANALDVKADNGSGADSDPDGDVLSVTAVGATDNGGTASINDAGTPLDTTDDFIEYTPAADFFGVETFSYTIDDGNGQTDTATVTVTVTNSNDPPIAEDDAFTVAEDSIANALDVKVDNGNGADSDPDGDTLSVTTVGATDNGGTASINDAGTPGDTTDDFVEYTPALDFFGVETFTYTIDDGNGQTDTATVTVTVTNSNDPPIAEDDAFTVAEDSIANALDVKADNGSGADSDPDGDVLSVTAVGATDNGGTASINDAGTPLDTTDDFIEYTPAADFFGFETFSYTIDDGNGQTDTATVTVTVTNSNDPPIAEDDAFTVAEDSVANALDVKADNGSGADSDPDGDMLSVTAVGATDNGGTASINDAGTPLDTTDDFIEYTPAADFFGVETFTYTIDDGNGQTDIATVTVTVTNGNDPPIAEDDAFTVAEDSIANALDVKVDNGNGADSDPDGDTLSVTAVGATDNGGTASINDAGTPLDTTDDFIEYTPAADFFGVETFSYTIDDGNGETDIATVTVTVTNGNDPPIAEDDAFTVAEDSIANALDVKIDNGNGADTDPDGDTLSVTTVGATDNGGTASINDAGTPLDTTDDFIEYTPAADFFGVETFTYTIDDGNGQTDTATVMVTVTNSNDPPIAEDDAFTVAEDSIANALDVKVDNGSGADSDPDGDTLSVTAVGPTDNGGAVAINDAGTPLDTTDDFVEYTPVADFFGVETFSYTIDDGNGETDIATVTVTVTNGNDPPIAEDDAFTVAEDSISNALDVKIDNGNGADSDPDGDTLSVTAVGPTDNGGTVAINDAGTPLDTTDDFIEYSPAADFFGVETFNYTIDDGNGENDTATVTMTVTGASDPPTAEDDAFTVAEDSISNALDVKADNGNGPDSDPDGDTLSVTAVGPTDNGGSVSIDDAGTPADTTDDFLVYTPAPDFFGVETFSYTVDDGNGDSDSATVTVTVTNQNDPPVAEDDAFAVQAGSTGNPLDVLADNGAGADGDPDGDQLTITSAGPADNGGAVAIDDNGTPGDPTDDFLVYSPAVGFFGTEMFSYTIDDGNGETASATVTVTVNAVAVNAVVAEIAPNNVLAGTPAVSFTYDIRPQIAVGNSGVQVVEINAPAGYANLSVTGAETGGTPLVQNCPTPGIGQYCSAVVLNVMSVTLGGKVTTDNTQIRVYFDADTPASAGSADFTSSVHDGPLPKVAAFPGDADGDPADANSISVVVGQTQGQLLELSKSANKREVFVGGVVTYGVEIRNPSTSDPVTSVQIADTIPVNFKYVPGSVRLNGAAIADPAGVRTLVFDIGTVPAFVDGNSNGTVDPGEPGHVTLLYQLSVGSGATPGLYRNVAVARDFCDTCFISNETTADVEVGIDPLFELGTIIGKVFEDRNRNDWQDPDEPGVANVMVVLDDGTYALTDEHGRYNFPIVTPGNRMLKINLSSLPPGSEAATEKSRIAWVSPGLMVKVNFGVILRVDSETIGTPAVPAMALEAGQDKRPIEIQGSADALSLLVNGQEIRLPSSDVRLGRERLEENVRMVGGRLERPVRFGLEVDAAGDVASWILSVRDAQGRKLRSLEGIGPAPDELSWDGRTDGGEMVPAGEIYQYDLSVIYRDGSHAGSPRRLFGVDRAGVISLNLMGEAFESGRDTLSPEARRILQQAAEILRRHPDEKVVIEGHSDSVGSDADNVELSQRRARSAASYLVNDMGLAVDRFAVRGRGEEQPLATNETETGRALNRRVEIHGEMDFEERVDLLEQHRTNPAVRINGETIDTEGFGRFGTSVSGTDGTVEVELSDRQGRSVRTSIALPDVDITAPAGRLVLPFDAPAGGCVALVETDRTRAPGESVARCELVGRTQPGNRVEVDGHGVDVALDGSFTSPIELDLGSNLYGVVVQGSDGLRRMANLGVDVSDRGPDGELLLITQGVPSLTVNLPPTGVRLRARQWNYAGVTDRGNRVQANGQEVEVGEDGRFRGTVELPQGTSRLVFQAIGPDGTSGTIEREVEVAKHDLFLLAFADGRFGKRKVEGLVEGSGVQDPDDYFSEGRLALYLKGTISGKYLITAAFDSGEDELGSLFKDLDGEATRQLLVNLDPDRIYPVYGDGSTLVFDAQSEGKLYLALESDEIHLLVGNYALTLDDTELAAYRRTLYGANFTYQSVSRTKYGDPDTEIAIFGANVRQTHVRDELRATGGSIYYLSHKNVVGGSEKVTLFVRDKNTGLILQRIPQRQNVDYLVKYPEGRVMFQRPVSSVIDSGSIVDEEVLSGHPVYIHVDYETVLDDFEKTSAGGRVRKQIGDHFAVGGTYIDDELDGGSYELAGLDAEVRLGRNTRIVAEYADSEGKDAETFVSDDGGLTYRQDNATALQQGAAWKVAAELDVGEWFGQADRYQVNLYYKELEPGFFSSGNFAEQGTEKKGVHANLDVTKSDKIQLRHDEEERTGGGPDPTSIADQTIDSIQWLRTRKRWGVTVELFSRKTEDVTSATTIESDLGAGQFWILITEKLKGRLEHQNTFSGKANDQTSLGLEYQLLPSLALELVGLHGDRGQSARAGLIFTQGESEIYISQRFDDSQAERKTTTVMGSKSPIGPSSHMYSEYQWEDSDTTGDRTLSLMGFQRQWDPEGGLKVLLSGEMANMEAAGGDSRRSAVSASVSYSRPDKLTAFTRQEVRLEEGAMERTQYFTVNQVDYKANPSTSVLGRYRYSKTLDRNLDIVESRFEERTVGVAFRPVRQDRFNLLSRYTRLDDQRPINVQDDSATRTKMDVLALETSFEFHRRVEWLAKEAFRAESETVAGLPEVDTESFLTIQRLNINLWRPIYFGVEYRILTEERAEDRREGWLSELTWSLVKNFRVGAGYNFTDFSDDELSQNDYSVRGWFFRVQGRY